MRDINKTIVIVGAGFTGLVSGFQLAQMGWKVTIVEKSKFVGGLASNFMFEDGVELERFYHHWFNHDEHIMKLISDLGLSRNVVWSDSKTGMYLNGRTWKLSSPVDLLKFRELPFWSRVRLGVVTLLIRSIRNWKKIESKSIEEWLRPLVGDRAYDTVWNPLIVAKFSTFASEISAVWMWKKLALRGSTRGVKGAEQLGYFKGGFGKLSEEISSRILELGGEIVLDDEVLRVNVDQNNSQIISSITTSGGRDFHANHFLFTNSFREISRLFKDSAPRDWSAKLDRVNYLGNICLVLRLRESLSGTYWLNVNDPGFPFVGVIEHTNLDSPTSFEGSHIAYLSRYIDTNNNEWVMSETEYFDYAIPYLKKMFPTFSEQSVIDYKVWKSEFAQPVTERNYSAYVPGHETPFINVSVYTMAQIYPEDRGTNYAVREGVLAAKSIDLGPAAYEK